MSVNVQKCAIIGCGFVGATTAYTLIQSELFSEIVLIDIDRKKAEGEAMDLVHGLPFISPVKIYAGDYNDLSDAAIVIITAGANQKPGQTRTDLVKTNVKIFHSIVENIVKYNRDGILLVVTNPVANKVVIMNQDAIAATPPVPSLSSDIPTPTPITNKIAMLSIKAAPAFTRNKPSNCTKPVTSPPCMVEGHKAYPIPMSKPQSGRAATGNINDLPNF